nr:hypothetical protein [Tanacetum cinerariifolium]
MCPCDQSFIDDELVEIDSIMFHLSRKNTVKKLAINNEWGWYQPPFSLFSFHQLADLRLSGCAFSHLPKFNEFGSLTSLSLGAVHMSIKELLHLLSNCPSLKTMTLVNEMFFVSGFPTVSDYPAIFDLFGCLPVIESLSIPFGIFRWFKSCVHHKVPRELPIKLNHLKYLYLHEIDNLSVEEGNSSSEEDNLLTEDDIRSFTLGDYSDIWLEHLSELHITSRLIFGTWVSLYRKCLAILFGRDPLFMPDKDPLKLKTSDVLRKRPLEAFQQSCYLRIVANWSGLSFDPLCLPVAPPSPDYMPGPEYPPFLDYPLPIDASPIAASPDYVADSNPEEDPEDDQTDYPADGKSILVIVHHHPRRAVDVTRFKFRYPLYHCVLRDLRDAPLPMLDSFACPALFSRHTGKNVSRDPAPVAIDFNSHDYATLFAHLSLFRKFPEEFLCLVGLSRHYTLDEETYPRFLHKNEKDMDLFAFIHAPGPTKVKIIERERVGDEPLLLQTIVSHTVPLLPVAPDRADSELETSTDKLFDEGGSDVAPLEPRRQRKRKTIVAEAGGSLHSPKKLREDHGTPSGTTIAGKFRSAVKRLLAGAVLNAEDEVDSLVRSSVLVMIAVTTTTLTVDLVVVVKEKTAKPSAFVANYSFVGGADPNAGVFSDLTGSDFLVNGVRTVIDPDTDLQKVYLFIEFNAGAARQMFLSVEVRMRTEYKIREKRRLKSAVDEKDELLKAMDKEIKNLKAHMVLKEAEVTEAIRLRVEASNFVTVEKSLRDEVNALNGRHIILEKEQNALDVKVADLEASAVHELKVASFVLQEKLSSYDNLTGRLEEFQDAHLKVINDKFDKLYADFFGDGSSLGGEAIEKGMQDGLSAEITHGMQSRALKDVAAYNPSAKADYISALQRLQSVNFSLLAELRSNKDASIDIVMNILCLEETLAERLGLTELQPHVDQLMIKENIAGQRSALRDVFIPLSDPFSAEVLTSAGVAPISVDDYVVEGTDDQAGTAGNVDPFPNVDDAELNILL